MHSVILKGFGAGIEFLVDHSKSESTIGLAFCISRVDDILHFEVNKILIVEFMF